MPALVDAQGRGWGCPAAPQGPRSGKRLLASRCPGELGSQVEEWRVGLLCATEGRQLGSPEGKRGQGETGPGLDTDWRGAGFQVVNSPRVRGAPGGGR